MIQRNPETRQPQSLIDNWCDLYFRQGNGWANKAAAAAYGKMVDEGQTQVSESGSSSSTSNVDEIVILENVLGNHRGHRLGVKPKMTQRRSSSTSSSSGSQSEMPTACLAPDMQQWLLSLHASHTALVKEMMELRPRVERTVISPRQELCFLGPMKKMMKLKKKKMEKMLT
ncbi:hypothetical protein L484_026070 [Morus notabilis]|uniref:Uncharacterized protein n=1 Tax=Morus notabilis TaxID=981085 RepID=W9RG39_9ROSA|nr:hypothetical protein L484_026070 [Morus notabilis]